MDQPDFDFSEPLHSAWNEVPQPLFLSWSTSMQLAYCATRDEDAALRSDDAAEATWFRGRAAAYKEQI